MYERIRSDISQPYYVEQFPNDGQRFVAWYLRNIYGLNTVQAKDCITDGPGDKQIDAVYVDDQAQTAYIIQGKFYSGPSVDAAPLREVLSSWMLIKDLPKLQEFANDKLQSKITELATAIEEDYHICFELLTTSSLTPSAQDDLAAYNKQLTEDDKLSAAIVLVDSDLLQARLEEALDHARPYINHEFRVESDKVIQMQIGETKVAIVALPLRECLRIPGIKDGSLFRKNVRQSLGSNKVNRGIARTIKNEPGEFFFLHNGITAICSAMEYMDGILRVKELNVVNGCQSLSTILNCSESAKKADDAYIMFRFYEISDTDRADSISTSTNSQTAVKARDLRSNDKFVLALKKAYEQRDPDGYFVTKRGEEPNTAKYNSAHIVYLTNLGKELIAWHSQRPTMSYSENRVFDVYFDQLFHRDYKPEDVQALAELHKAILPYWEPDSLKSLDENLITIKAYGPYHHLFAVSMVFCELNKMSEGVPSPSLALQKLKDSGLLDQVVELAGQCVSSALRLAVEDAAAVNKPLNTQNWSKNKNSLKEIRAQVRAALTPNIMWPGSVEQIKKYAEALHLPNDAFEMRWTAD
ncbi:MAG: AIPR family protein [Parasporobacterium sp.]|nr:AIPR family protein [Parasporobacterium sp.]